MHGVVPTQIVIFLRSHYQIIIMRSVFLLIGWRMAHTKLRTIQLGYNLPKSMTNRLAMQRLRFYLSAQNLLTIHSKSFTGVDPENPTMCPNSTQYHIRYKRYILTIIIWLHNMKKIIYSALVLATLSMTSCSDFLDEHTPQATLSDEQVKELIMLMNS